MRGGRGSRGGGGLKGGGGGGGGQTGGNHGMALQLGSLEEGRKHF